MITLKLSVDDVVRLREALDAYAYFQVSEEHERNNGFVYYPDPHERANESPDDTERWKELDAVQALDSLLHDELRRQQDVCCSTVPDSSYCHTSHKGV